MGRAAVAAFALRSGWTQRVDGISYEETLLTDQWSVSGALDDHRPLLRYVLNDAAGTEFYVSSRTGEVVRDTRRRERILNFGAVTHWLYPTFVRKDRDLWEWIVDTDSLAT